MMNISVRPRLASTLLLATALAASPLTAQAYWHGGGGCWNCGGGGGNFAAGALLGLGVGAVIASRPHYYAPPPPVYYAPPPVYYTPPPVAYYPAPRRVWIPPHWEGPYWIRGHWS